MTQRVYYGALSKGHAGYGIVFPDFWGCVSTGDSKEDVIAGGHEALQGHIEAMVAGGDAIPEPSAVTLERVRQELDDPADDCSDEDWTEVVPILVNVPDHLETIPVPIKASLIQEISRVAANNQDFIDRAIRRSLEEERKSA